MLLLYWGTDSKSCIWIPIYIPLCFYFIETLGEFLNKHKIYIPLCFYFMLTASSKIRFMSFIYIPLCFYFIQPPAANKAGRSIYIPLCFYFIKNDRLMDLIRTHLHSTMLLLYSSRSLHALPVQRFTFHYASTLWSLHAGKLSARRIYIPLCFYFMTVLYWQPHVVSGFTFHYASTLWKWVSSINFNKDEFTFHYASTLFPEILVQLLLVHIYIPLCFYFITVHSSAAQHIPHLHSTMLLLYKGSIQGGRTWRQFTFHYASTLWSADRGVQFF